MSAYNGGPAFPVLKRLDSPSHEYMADSTDGISMRDYFAAKAIGGLATSQDSNGTWRYGSSSDIAEEAYSIADAMIAERNKSK